MKTIFNQCFSAVAGKSSTLALSALAVFFSFGISAAGIRDVAPTAADAPVMLETENPEFGNFASFTSAPNNRLIASIANDQETIYFGLSGEANRDGDRYQNLGVSRYQFRVRRITDDGANPIVHGPFLIDNGNANVSTWDNAEYGEYPVTYTQNGEVVFQFTPGQAGEYSIEFSDVQPDVNGTLLIPYWDFTVADGVNGAAIDGRVYSRSWSFRTPPVTGGDLPRCEWDRAFNGDLYSYTDDGFVSRIDFANAGFAGLSFDVAFNSSGPGTTGDLAQDRMSIPNANATGQAAQFPIFLTLPDENLFPSGDCGTVTAADQFSCNGPDDFCLDVSVTLPGQVQVILDFNANGMLDDNSQDVVLVFEFTEDNLMACIPWNGLRGDGEPATQADTVDIIINYSQGVQHWAVFDVEFMTNGFCVETVRPICAATDNNILYWDDRDIVEEPGTGVPKDNRNGAGCRDIPRSWDFFAIADGQDCSNFQDDETVGYGDKNTLNTYWFANTTVEFRARVPVVSVSIDGNLSICEGGQTTLTVIDQSDAGLASFVWTGPGVDGLMTQSVTATQAGEYCVIVTSNNGCISTICATVEVIDFGNVDFPDDLFICFGDSIQSPIAGDPSLIYSWSPTTGIDDPTSNQPTFFPTATTQYIVTIMNAGNPDDGCEAMDTVLVTVSDEIGLQVNGGGPICEATATISATTLGNTLIQLIDADGAVVATATGTDAQFDVNVSGSDDYIVRATNGDGCTEEVGFNVTGGPVDIALPDTVTSCLSQELVLSVENLDPNDTLTYSWAPAELFEAGTANTATPVFNGEAGLYDVTLTATNQFGCTTQEVVTLVVIDENDQLSFTSELQCDGLTVQFTNTSSVGFGYLWLFGDGGFSTEVNPTYTYSSVGDFTVTLTIFVDQECVDDFSQTVTTLEATLIPAFDVSLDGCDGVSGTLNFTDQTVNLTNTALTYAWTFTGGNPATSAEQNPSVSILESGTVTASLTVTSRDGCEETIDSSFTVELNEIELTDIMICPGDSAQLNPGGEGDGRSYTWSPSPDFDANDPNPTTSVAGIYSVTVTSTNADFNCESMTTVEVTVADSINIVISGPDGPLTGPDAPNGGGGNGGGGGGGNPDIVIPTIQTCDEMVDLTIDLSDNGGNPITVTYTDINGNPIGGGDGTGITLNSNQTDTVIVTSTDQFGCTRMDTIAIQNVQVNATIDVGADGLMICSSTDTSVTVVNNIPGDTLTYAWTPNDIITGPLDGPTIMFTTPAEGSVDLMVNVMNQFGCDTTITVTIENIPFMPNMFPDVVTPCFADDFVIMGGPAVAGYTYEYETGQNLDTSDPSNPVGNFTEDTSIRVTITDPATGCSSVQDIEVDVQPEISFMTMPGDTSLCEPGSVTVNGTTVNDDVVITWYNDAGLTDVNTTGSTVTIDAPVAGQTYTIYGQAVDTTTGCEQVVPVTVTVSELSTGLPLGEVNSCAGEDAPMLFATGGFNETFIYEFEPAGVVGMDGDGNPIFTGIEDQVITVTATDPATGCSATSTINATYRDLGVLVGSADPAMILLGNSSTLTVTGCDDCDYVWTAPNGTIEPDDSSVVVVMPDMAGELIYLVDVSSNGCMATLEIPLQVDDPICDVDRIFVPNAFSPNGDGNNDVLRVRSGFGDQLTEFRWIIYDRWGQEVYASDSFFDSWDGTTEGDDLEPDVYGYWLRVVCPTGAELIQQGNITILR